jgi:ribosomal protein RSM22 (predicted rRNA methylase)
MQLPYELKEAIEALVAKDISLPSLQSAREEVTSHYRQGGASAAPFKHRAHLLSYLVTRLPATFAACVKVCEEIRKRLPHFSCSSIADLGAGPGTGTWAALQVFEGLEMLHLVEQEREAIAVGKQMGAHWKNSNWLQANLEEEFPLPQVDLALFSYSLGELKNPIQVLERVWNGATGVIAIIEPGTPRGFEKIRAWRQFAIEKGAEIVAPCPHRFACPMPQGDWCHFAARVERSRVHRQVKKGDLGYEDEKYSYLVIAHPGNKPSSFEGRAVRAPLKRKGHVQMTLCHWEGGLVNKVVTRSQKEVYRIARDLEWGDSF